MKMNFKSAKTLMLLLTLAMTSVHAQETKKSSTEKKNDIDNEITNARMRAESGSKSPLSMSIGLGYNGGALDDPFGDERPNISGDPEVETATYLGLDVSGRYRFTKNDSISFGAGMGATKPFSNPDSDVPDPYLSYSRVYKVGVFQTISSATYTFGTSDSYKDAEISGVATLQQYMMANIGKTGLTLGGVVDYSYYMYKDETPVASGLTRFSLGLYPMLEYTFNDTFSFRTVFGYFNYRRVRGASNSDLKRRYEYQSIGIGISVSRDIYLYPNIQFLADDADVKKTNIGFSATINLF